MFYPNIETVRIYAKQYNRIPIYARIPYDGKDIVSIYAAFRGSYSFLLESGVQTYNGRYSIIALPCQKRFLATMDSTFVYDQQDVQEYHDHPMERLQSLLDDTSPIYPELPVFTGGAIGHFNYDVIRLFEDIPNSKKDSENLPLMQFGFVKDLIVIDHQHQDVYFISNMEIHNLEINYENAKQCIQNMQEQYLKANYFEPERMSDHTPVRSNYTKAEFIDMVNKGKDYIKQGDIFQVVLSQRMQTTFTQDPLSAYAQMRKAGASPYMYYLDFDDYAVAGVSPELLLQARGDVIRTMPIAGTRKRGKTSEEDQQLMQELRQDPKENAEHMMLVDLGRNDIGYVAKIGSVEVKQMKEIQLYSHVMHMTSVVSGLLDEHKTMFDALGSLLPAGTLSGAPKIRAMEIIDELETTQREIYGGAIGFLGFNGQFDACITIRTMIFHKNHVFLQAGAGIVKDSDPEKEYEETLLKAAVLLAAIGKEHIR